MLQQIVLQKKVFPWLAHLPLVFVLLNCKDCLLVQVWSDGHKKARGDPSFLTLWQPVAPAGYVAMGLLASTGGTEPRSLAQVGMGQLSIDGLQLSFCCAGTAYRCFMVYHVIAMQRVIHAMV